MSDGQGSSSNSGTRGATPGAPDISGAATGAEGQAASIDATATDTVTPEVAPEAGDPPPFAPDERPEPLEDSDPSDGSEWTIIPDPGRPPRRDATASAATRVDTAPPRARRGWTRWRRPIFLVLCGAALAAGQAPFGLWPLALLGLVGIFAIFSARRPLRDGLTFGASYFGLSLTWIVEPFLVDIARHGWMAPFALILLALGLGLIWAVAFRAAAWLKAGPVGLAVCLGAVELFRAYAMTGFPWNAISYIWLDTAPMQLVSLIGPHGLTLATLLALAAPVTAARASSRAALGPTLLLLPALVGAGMWVGAEPVTGTTPTANSPIVRLVQPNATQRRKWDPEWIPVFFDRLIELSAAAPQDPRAPRPDLVIWPETAIAYDLEGSEQLRRTIVDAAGGVPVALGYQRREAGRFYNSLGVLSPSGELGARYDKQHLVPFGEYVPFGGWLSRLGIRGLAQVAEQGFSPGPGPTSLRLGKLGRALPLICYEAVFPDDLRTGGPRPDWILQVTNDGWFGRFTGPYQHLAQARIRAIERRLPMVRVANTGVSAVIDARGRVLASLPLGAQGFLDQRLPPAAPDETPYGKSGDWPMVPAYLLLGGLLLWRRLSR